MSADDHPVISPKKLIEVALPLDAINAACAREKSIRHGHPSTLHLWWARRPLAAARAVIFSQLVNDPGYQQGEGFKYGRNKKEAATERKRLFQILEDLVRWESTTDEHVLERARTEIRRSWREVCQLNKDHPQAKELFNPDILPAFHDPFAGGGAIPLEAQRLGMEAYASDLNPVAVLINKSMIEIPTKFTRMPPVSRRLGCTPQKKKDLNLEREWPGVSGLAEDVRYYGEWMRAEAHKRIGHLYPMVKVTAEMARERPDLEPLVGDTLTVIAWLWARTVKSPNPALSHRDVPLAATFVLASKKGKEAYVAPLVNGDDYRFAIKIGTIPESATKGTSGGKRQAFRCLISDVPIDYKYIRGEGKAGRMGQKLMAIVAQGKRGRIYLNPTASMEEIALSAKPTWTPDCEMPTKHRNFQPPGYGMTNLGQIFTARQLVSLNTFSDLVAEAREKAMGDAVDAGMPDDARGLEDEGVGAKAYAEAVSVYLAFAVDKSSDYWSSLCPWLNQPKNEIVGKTFGRQALPMIWDFAEANPFSGAGGDIVPQLEYVTKCIEKCVVPSGRGTSVQASAQTQQISDQKVVSTDPPYYDNFCYADLSDFFYVWLRRNLRPVFPALLATIAVPKQEELIASPHRHSDKLAADRYFLDGMTLALRGLARHAHPEPPITIYYAFKQSDTESEGGTSSTGWEAFLEAIHASGLQVTGTWPMRTERPTAFKVAVNALASSIVLVCRRRSAEASSISRRQFIRELNNVLPEAIDAMTKGSGDDRSPVAPVDLSQAILGPGMAVFSKYAAVLEADGTPMTVKTALQLINRFLAEDDFDGETQFCLQWFEQHGWDKAKFGEADTLARAKGTSVDGVKAAGVIESGGGNVRLLKWKEYPADWNASLDTRLPVWEVLHQLIRAYSSKGDAGAGKVLNASGGKVEAARQLAYRLYTLCERKGWAEDARAYNEVVTGWSGIEKAAGAGVDQQRELFDS
jgi:putative DNA methylase